MNYKSISKLFMLGFILAFIFSSCTKEGPMGPAGADGADGTNGTDGTNGVDGNLTCLECHTKSNMDAISMQYAMSSHGTPGFELGYAGPRSGCMDCHSNEGFLFAAIGYHPTENLDFATKITCGTCHGDHVVMEDPIPAPMLNTKPVTAKADGITVFDFEDSSNTCANCHQSRKNGSYYAEAYAVGDTIFDRNDNMVWIQVEDSVYLSSSHATPHYTTMTNTIFGVGGYSNEPGEVMGAHKGAGCVGCHMGEADTDTQNGGHTMKPSVASCNKCHPSATDFDIKGLQTKIHEAEEEVAQALVTAGILNESHDAVVGIYHEDVFEAYWNYKIIHYDASMGVHNPEYSMMLLDYAKEKLGL